MTKQEIQSIIDITDQKKKEEAEQKYSELLEKEIIQRTIVGIDVYRYSKMDKIPQSLLPYCLDILIEGTFANLLEYEPAFFSKELNKESNDAIIHTGDGFYVPFIDPIRATLFCIYFQSNLSSINTLNNQILMRSMVGSISIRYAMTIGPVYYYENKLYGKPIIQNARLLSLDKLNRFLLSNKVFLWFEIHTNGIETIGAIKLEDIKKIDKFTLFSDKSLIFVPEQVGFYRFRTLILQKIGDQKVKDDTEDIYSLFIQVLMKHKMRIEIDKYVISIGNLNTHGIVEK